MIPVGVCTEFVIGIVLGKFLESLGKLAEELVCHANKGDARRYCFQRLWNIIYAGVCHANRGDAQRYCFHSWRPSSRKDTQTRPGSSKNHYKISGNRALTPPKIDAKTVLNGVQKQGRIQNRSWVAPSEFFLRTSGVFVGYFGGC